MTVQGYRNLGNSYDSHKSESFSQGNLVGAMKHGMTSHSYHMKANSMEYNQTISKINNSVGSHSGSGGGLCIIL